MPRDGRAGGSVRLVGGAGSGARGGHWRMKKRSSGRANAEAQNEYLSVNF